MTTGLKIWFNVLNNSLFESFDRSRLKYLSAFIPAVVGRIVEINEQKPAMPLEIYTIFFFNTILRLLT